MIFKQFKVHFEKIMLIIMLFWIRGVLRPIIIIFFWVRIAWSYYSNTVRPRIVRGSRIRKKWINHKVIEILRYMRYNKKIVSILNQRLAKFTRTSPSIIISTQKFSRTPRTPKCTRPYGRYIRGQLPLHEIY